MVHMLDYPSSSPLALLYDVFCELICCFDIEQKQLEDLTNKLEDQLGESQSSQKVAREAVDDKEARNGRKDPMRLRFTMGKALGGNQANSLVQGV